MIGLYLPSLILHAAALLIGVFTLWKYGDRFRDSRPHHLLRSSDEQTYWTISISTCSNIAFIFVILRHIVSGDYFLRNELFAVCEAFGGASFVLWHLLTLDGLASENRGEHVG